jgi:hypothetical protein
MRDGESGMDLERRYRKAHVSSKSVPMSVSKAMRGKEELPRQRRHKRSVVRSIFDAIHN